MEPVSAIATVWQLVGGTIKLIDEVYKYGLDFADAPRAILDLKHEMRSLRVVLDALRQRCENAFDKHTGETPAWVKGLWEVHGRHFDKDGVWLPEYRGVLSQIMQAIREAMDKLNPTKQWKNTEAYQRISWHFKKEKFDEIHATISRCLNGINVILALKGDETLEQTQDLVRESFEYNKTQFGRLEDRMLAFEERQKREEERQNQERAEAEREEIIQWLSPFSFLAKQDELWTKCFKQVGESLWQDQRFQAWMEGREWYLWCVGELGVGKTVLSSIMAHHILQTSHESPPPILTIYLDYKASKVQTLERLVGSLLQQLMQLNDSFEISDALRMVHKKAKRLGYGPTSYYKEVRKILVNELQYFDHVFILVDGFDELAPNERAELLGELRALKSGKLGLLLMSRAITEQRGPGNWDCNRCGRENFQLAFHCSICDSGNFDLCYECKNKGLWCDDATRTHRLEDRPHGGVEFWIEFPDSDIENYVRWEIGAEVKLGQPQVIDERDTAMHENPVSTPFQDLCNRDPKLPGQIVTEITTKAAGRFLYARLYLDSLKHKTNPLMLRKALRTFPTDTNDIYKEALERIQLQEREMRQKGLRILGIMTRARRSLGLEELRHALAVLTLIETFSEQDCREDDIEVGKDEPKTILGATSSLITIEDNQVRLVHRSLEEYLQQEELRKKWLPDAESDLAKACMAYLNLTLPSTPSEDEYFTAKNAKFPFLQYAAQYWGDHIRSASSTPENVYMQDKVMRFLNDSQRLTVCMQAAWVTNLGGHDTWDVWRNLDKLHICAWFGLSAIVSVMDPEKGTVDKVEPKYGQTPLMYACRKGHYEVARRLLELGASQRKVSARGRTALFEAILGHHSRNIAESSENPSRHGKVVKLLVSEIPGDLDIDITHNQEFLRTALMLAARRGQFEIVEILLDHPGIGIDLQDENGMTALVHAIRGDYYEVTKRLLDAEASMEIVDFQAGRTPLRCAAERNNKQVVDLLLKSGADPYSKDREGGTAMLRAVNRGAIKALKKMIKHGVELDSVDVDGQSLLHGAARNGYPDIARLLLQDPVIADQLLKKGIKLNTKDELNPNTRDKLNMTPLHDASRYGHAAVASALLENGADPFLLDDFQRTPLFVAWQYGNNDVMRLLTEHKTIEQQPLQSFDDKDLPIWAMARQGLTDLLAEAIATRPQDLPTLEPYTDNSPLHCAIEANKPDILDLLLETKTLPINHPNHTARTPLHIAALFGNTFATTALISHSATLDPQDRWGDEPLVLAQSNHHFDTMLLLIKAHASVPKAKIDTKQLFFHAVETGDVDATRILIDKHGVDRSVQNSEGVRAMQIATAGDDVEMMLLLRSAQTVQFRGVVGEDDDDERVGEGTTGMARKGFVPFRSRPLQLS